MELNKICSEYFPFGVTSDIEYIKKEWEKFYSQWKEHKIKDEEIYSRYIFLESSLLSITSTNPQSLEINKEDLNHLVNFSTSITFNYNTEDSFFHLIYDVKKRKISKNHLEALSQIIIDTKDNIQRNRALAAYLNFFPSITYFDQPKNQFYIENFKKISEGLFLKKKPEMFRPFFDILKSDGIINVIRVLNHVTPDIDWIRTISRGGSEVLLLENLTGHLLKMGMFTKYADLKKELQTPNLNIDQEKIYLKSLFATLKNEEDLIREINNSHPKSLVFSLKESYFQTSLSNILIKNGNWRILSKFQDNYSLDELLESNTLSSKKSSQNTIKSLDKILSKTENGINKGNLKSFVAGLFIPQTFSLPNLITNIESFGRNTGNSFNSSTIEHVWSLIGKDSEIFNITPTQFLKESMLGTGLIRKQFNQMTSSEWMERNNVGIPLFNFILALAFHDFDKQFNFQYLYGENTLMVEAFTEHDSKFKLPISGLNNLDILDEREVIYNIQTRLNKVFDIWKQNENPEFRPTSTYVTALECIDFVQSLLLSLPFSMELSEDYVAVQKSINEMSNFIQKSDYAFTSFTTSRESHIKQTLENFQNKGLFLEHKIMKQIVTSTMNKTKTHKF